MTDRNIGHIGGHFENDRNLWKDKGSRRWLILTQSGASGEIRKLNAWREMVRYIYVFWWWDKWPGGKWWVMSLNHSWRHKGWKSGSRWGYMGGKKDTGYGVVWQWPHGRIEWRNLGNWTNGFLFCSMGNGSPPEDSSRAFEWGPFDKWRLLHPATGLPKIKYHGLKRDKDLWISPGCWSCWGMEGWRGSVGGCIWCMEIYCCDVDMIWLFPGGPMSYNCAPHSGNSQIWWNLLEVEPVERSLGLWVMPLKMLRYLFRGHLLGLMEILL